MAVEAPNKADIEAIFKRLRSIPSNKTCFDCGAKNPTWSTVTFGVFICIDCSSVHRNLGVHLTFVRSTQLDTQWTWVQLRSMQLGGNANAAAFFRQHNCITMDAQTKYNSRAAMLYKEKLSNLAVQSLKIHGTQLHIDSGTEAVAPQEKKEEDFFAVTEAFPDTTPVNTNGSFLPKIVATEPVKSKESETECQGAGPNVAVISNPSPAVAEPKVAKSLIGQRKPAAKKPGMGAKKGLGATKVHTNFDEIEKEAQLADSMRSQKSADVKPEETESQTNSLRLAYQDLSLESKKQSERLQKVDPSKAQQVERLGMGIMGANSGPRNISHSAISDMAIIQQDSSAFTSSSSASVLASLDRKTFAVAEESSNSFYSKNSGLDDLLTRGGSSKSSRDSDWDMLSDFAPVSKPSQSAASYGGPISSSSNYGSSTTSGKSSSSTYGSSTKTKEFSSGGPDSGEAQKKFGSAKAISSDQYFQDSGSADQERRSNLSRFQGSSGISSSDYFGTGNSSTGGSKNSGGTGYNIQAPDLDEVKESVRQGVTKVASKLSSLANDFASSIQDRYGY